MKVNAIDTFFKRKISDTCDASRLVNNEDSPTTEVNTSKCPRLQKWDPRLYEVIRAYLEMGPYQIRLSHYPFSDATYCFSCYLFSKQIASHGMDAFPVKGFNNWKKFNDEKRCVFLNHVGQDLHSPHNNAEKSCQDLLNQSRHIGCAFKGHDEISNSRNRGNFLELITLLASYNDKVSKVILDNALRNAKYTYHMIQNSKFCIIIDETRDESRREQMTIVLRYVDEKGFIKERFFDLVHVQDITAITLKEEICDGVSKMRGEWNNLQALFLNDCPYAYYLVLVAASREVIPIHNFFSNLNFIINIISASCKCHDQLQAGQTIEIANMLAIDQLETEKIIESGFNYSICGDATATYKKITSFNFIFILHLVKEIKFIEDGWDNLLEVVKAFCEKHNNEVLDMNSPYVVKHGRHQHVDFNMEHHYRVEDPYKSFNMDDICCIVEKYYVFHFTEQNKKNVPNHSKLQNLFTISNLCQGLVETRMSKVYFLVDRLICLLLTIPVSTVTTERTFSVMKIVKTRLHNKMDNEFLTDNLAVYIERDC
ncbi:hypothetical protein ES332_A08G151200v1 [Gossypium tomentosum]|uniref:TTF-type domain-containing protein n=1 Tax=Gossypium tomentosum TaxID=34277 RepID=A0A5D2PHS6_GOSTO|nr:hypothetical protein ES332_A08G151200v1 [Gossypium tomentosum]